LSKIALKSNPLGTGTFTIESPNSNTDRTVVLPDGNGSVVLTDATQTLTNKSISAAQINSGTLGVARGGTGASTLTANNVLLGNGTSALQAVAPGTSGNVLTSNGTTWTSAAPAAAAPVVNTFNSNGTWTKPSTGTMARIQVWSGGGGGARVNTSERTAYGGGGGGYVELQVPLSTLGSTVSVTIGAGGAGRTGSTGNGVAGGASSFGSIAVVAGGSGGQQGLSPTAVAIPNGGYPSTPGTVVWLQQANKHWVGGGTSTLVGNPFPMPESIFGGGMGGAANGVSGSERGGSVFAGEGGSRGGQGLGNGAAGTAPGGGGGGANTDNNGGNGAAGRVVVTVW
jgi:hypothetical protein